MAPLRGWAPVGQRLHAKVPYGHWKTMTFIAALRCDRIDAPFVFDQPINAASFTAWVEEHLCPTLMPGDIVVMDNLSSHKKPAVRAAIRARGARLLFLPPYSPDLNPIEQVFAKLKHLLRKAAERSVETTWRRIGTLLNAFPPHECANYLRNSGYGAAECHYVLIKRIISLSLWSQNTDVFHAPAKKLSVIIPPCYLFFTAPRRFQADHPVTQAVWRL
jgi:transposase